MERIVTIVSLTRVLVSCVVGVLLGCISVVFTTARESVMPDSKENKQADAGSRLLSKAFPLRRVVVELFIEGLFIHLQQECSAKPFMRSILCHKGTSRLSQVLAYDFLSQCKFSPLEHLSSAVLALTGPLFPIGIENLVYVNRVLPREVAQAVKGSNDTRFYGVGLGVGKELPRNKSVVCVLLLGERSQRITGNVSSIHVCSGDIP